MATPAKKMPAKKVATPEKGTSKAVAKKGVAKKTVRAPVRKAANAVKKVPGGSGGARGY